MNQATDSSAANRSVGLAHLSPLTVTERELCWALAPFVPATTWLIIGPTAWLVHHRSVRPTPIWPLPPTAMPLTETPAFETLTSVQGSWVPFNVRGRVVGGLVLPDEQSVSSTVLEGLASLVEGIYTRRMAIRQTIWQHLLEQLRVRYAAGEERQALLSEVLLRSLNLVPQSTTDAPITIPHIFDKEGDRYGRSYPFWHDELHFIELALAITHPAIMQLQVVGLAAAGVAHDINNLMTVILGRAQLLELDVGEDQLFDLQMIETAAEISAGSARRLQRFTQVEHTVIQPVNMTTVALAAVAEAKRELSLLGNIQLETSIPDLPPAAGASGLIYTALKNLIISAARSLPDGGIIQIGGAADEHYVWIEVTDPALPPSTDLQAISAQIQRAHALELIIARQTARVHGGQVRIDANQAGGTCMRFILPRWEAQNGVTHASMETS